MAIGEVYEGKEIPENGGSWGNGAEECSVASIGYQFR